MNFMQWLYASIRKHTKPTATELAWQQAQREADYERGRQDERYALLAELAAETASAKAIDEALKQPDRHHGDVLHAWGKANRPGYKPITLDPAPIVLHAPFPWLSDDSRLNTQLPQTGAYDILSPETEHMPAFVRSLHKKRHERK
jgi:hypothetical protein